LVTLINIPIKRGHFFIDSKPRWRINIFRILRNLSIFAGKIPPTFPSTTSFPVFLGYTVILSKPNPFGTEEFVQFRQVFGLHRFKLYIHVVDGM
jgi:hypothetical protein